MQAAIRNEFVSLSLAALLLLLVSTPALASWPGPDFDYDEHTDDFTWGVDAAVWGNYNDNNAYGYGTHEGSRWASFPNVYCGDLTVTGYGGGSQTGEDSSSGGSVPAFDGTSGSYPNVRTISHSQFKSSITQDYWDEYPNAFVVADAGR